MKCWICEHEGQKMNDCFYKPKSKKYRSTMRPSKKIQENRSKRNLMSDNDDSKKNEFEFAFMAQEKSYITNKWFLDSCCSRHLANSKDAMLNYRTMEDNDNVSLCFRRRVDTNFWVCSCKSEASH